MRRDRNTRYRIASGSRRPVSPGQAAACCESASARTAPLVSLPLIGRLRGLRDRRGGSVVVIAEMEKAAGQAASIDLRNDGRLQTNRFASLNGDSLAATSRCPHLRERDCPAKQTAAENSRPLPYRR